MRVSVILSHPNSASFNHAIANSCVEALTQAGHSVTLHDLHAEGFDPVFGADEHLRDSVLPPAIAAQVEEITQAEGLVIVHPNYWCRPPAMLCGWVDRVLRPGRAYRFVPNGQGGARPEGLLKLRFALVVTTANTPPEVEKALYGDPLDLHWRKIVFGLCGVSNVERLAFSPVVTSSTEKRAGWLSEAAEAVRRLASS